MFFARIIQNRLLVASLSAWLIAQFAKLVLYAAVNRTIRFERLVGSGGMPSAHAATVCALVTSAARRYGPGSFEFAVTLVLALIVLYDARGVRFETGKQTMAITAIIDHFLREGTKIELPEIKLRELIGHTPLQVAVGTLLGVGVGFWLG